MLINSAPVEIDRAAHSPNDDAIARRFEGQAAATPGNLAIVTEEISLTYRELDALATNIAAYIAAESSIPERPVAILMEKGPLPVAAILGVAKAGRIFIPLELDAPEAWLTGVVADSKAAHILTD